MIEAIPFTRLVLAGEEMRYLHDAISNGQLASGGPFCLACERLLSEYFDGAEVLLTGSGSAALELAAFATGIGPGDEVILPSFTLASAANAICRAGARPVFVDVRPETMNLDERLVEAAITPRTRAIWPVHYAGVACAPTEISEIGERHGLVLVGDAAQAVGARHNGRHLGSLCDLSIISFGSQKNVACGEGGALVVNDEQYKDMANIARDKGTNRKAFMTGSASFYSWVGLGASLGMPELSAALLHGQIENIDKITQDRLSIVALYQKELVKLAAAGFIEMPCVPDHCEPNGHITFFYARSREERDRLLGHLNAAGIRAAFHYVPLHSSPFGQKLGYKAGDLPITENRADRLVRLPMFREMTHQQIDRVIAELCVFFA